MILFYLSIEKKELNAMTSLKKLNTNSKKKSKITIDYDDDDYDIGSSGTFKNNKEPEEEEDPTKSLELTEVCGINIPKDWLVSIPELAAYIEDMGTLQRKSFIIAMEHLKTSFDVSRSNGFADWLKSRSTSSSTI
jgi:hypothetical protein